MTGSLPRPADAAVATGIFMAQAVLPGACLAVAWLALAGEPAPFLGILLAAVVSAGFSLPLIYRRGMGVWPRWVLPGLAGLAIVLRLASGLAGVEEGVFLAILFLLALAGALRPTGLARFLASRQG